jgi:hypothetical protein
VVKAGHHATTHRSSVGESTAAGGFLRLLVLLLVAMSRHRRWMRKEEGWKQNKLRENFFLRRNNHFASYFPPLGL